MDSSPLGSPVHGILQARILEWVAISLFSKLYTNTQINTQSCPTLYDPLDCSLPGSSVHNILQVKLVEWVAISSPRGSWPWDWTHVSCVSCRFLTYWAIWKAPSKLYKRQECSCLPADSSKLQKSILLVNLLDVISVVLLFQQHLVWWSLLPSWNLFS